MYIHTHVRETIADLRCRKKKEVHTGWKYRMTYCIWSLRPRRGGKPKVGGRDRRLCKRRKRRAWIYTYVCVLRVCVYERRANRAMSSNLYNVSSCSDHTLRFLSCSSYMDSNRILTNIQDDSEKSYHEMSYSYIKRILRRFFLDWKLVRSLVFF